MRAPPLPLVDDEHAQKSVAVGPANHAVALAAVAALAPAAAAAPPPSKHAPRRRRFYSDSSNGTGPGGDHFTGNGVAAVTPVRMPVSPLRHREAPSLTTSGRTHRQPVRTPPPTPLAVCKDVVDDGVNMDAVDADADADAEAATILTDCLRFVQLGVNAVANDEFSRCFEPHHYTRNHRRYDYNPFSILLGGGGGSSTGASSSTRESILTWLRLVALWPYYVVDVAVRYGVLLPVRLFVLVTAMTLLCVLLPLARIETRFSGRMRHSLFLRAAQAWTWSLGGKRIRHHGAKPIFTSGEPVIFVANHSSFIDYFVLSAHGCAHATVAQQHGGVMGWLQTYVLKLNGSLMFHRSQKGDRHVLAAKMRDHVHRKDAGSSDASDAGSTTFPLLIFPEGTCVNNEYTVLFHRGAFALDAVVCPAAIKYDKKYGDPYWMSSRQSFCQHILYLMTRWELVADVWWLPPQRIADNESPNEFADRVKRMISDTAGLNWDGYMKNYFDEEKRTRMKARQQDSFTRELRKRRLHSLPSNIKRESVMNALTVSTDNGDDRTTASGDALADAVPMMQPSSSSGAEPQFPAHLTSQQVLDIKNRLLQHGDGASSTKPISPPIADGTDDLVHIWDMRKAGVVDTWRRYTRIKDGPGVDTGAIVDARRIENSSWRLWFKERADVVPQRDEQHPGRE